MSASGSEARAAFTDKSHARCSKRPISLHQLLECVNRGIHVNPHGEWHSASESQLDIYAVAA